MVLNGTRSFLSVESKRTVLERRPLRFPTRDNFVPLVVPGLSTNLERSSSSASLSQDSLRREGGTSIQETGAFPKNPTPSLPKKRGMTGTIRKTRWQIFLLLVAGFQQRTSESNRIACIRTQFSGIRSRTAYESGNEIKETQYLYSYSPKNEIATYA